MNALVKGHSFQPQNHYKKYRDSNIKLTQFQKRTSTSLNTLINIEILQNEWKKSTIR